MSAIPETYKDSLAARIFPHRFRRIGNPYAFLNDVGIIPILEYIYKGNLLIDVAEALNVSYTILVTWAKNEGHEEAIEEAETVSAEGYLAEGLRRLREATNDFELKRAKEMINHARFMASKKDKGTYGSTEQTGADKAGVSYVFNIGGDVVTHQTKAVEQPKVDAKIIEGEATPVSLNILEHLQRNFEDVFPEAVEQKPAKRGRKPQLPVVGPFYD